MKKILSVLLAACFLLGGCASLRSGSSGAAEIDYSVQAQTYLEYIDAHFRDRNSGTDGHGKARDWIVAELVNAGYPEKQITFCGL